MNEPCIATRCLDADLQIDDLQVIISYGQDVF